MSSSLEDKLAARHKTAARLSAGVAAGNDPAGGENGGQGGSEGRPMAVRPAPVAAAPPSVVAMGPSAAQLDHMVGAAGGKYAVTIRQMEDAEREWLQTVAYANGLGHSADRIRGIALMKGVPDPFATG